MRPVERYAVAGAAAMGTRYRLASIAAIIVIALAAWAWMAGRSGGDRHAAAPPPVPVTVATAQSTDFPVYLNGLGTVEPFQTVTVKSRVDGEITKIAFRQGQMVKEGDLLVQIDPRPYQAALDQAQAKKAQDEANLKNAQANLERYETLSRNDFASRQQLENQQATVDQLKAQIKGDEAAVDNAQTQLGYTTIKSPLAGKTGFRLVDRGNIVRATDQTGIVSIVKLQPISVVFTAPEEEVQRINKALAAGEVPVAAQSSDGKRVLARGHLSLVNNEVDQAAGTIRMKASFANEDNALWPGLSVKTQLLVETLHRVVVVPDTAIQRGPNGLYAFVIGQDNKVEMAPVEISGDADGRSHVIKGLQAGQKVVVAGQYKLRPGIAVEARELTAAAAPAGQQK